MAPCAAPCTPQNPCCSTRAFPSPHPPPPTPDEGEDEEEFGWGEDDQEEDNGDGDGHGDGAGHGEGPPLARSQPASAPAAAERRHSPPPPPPQDGPAGGALGAMLPAASEVTGEGQAAAAAAGSGGVRTLASVAAMAEISRLTAALRASEAERALLVGAGSGARGGSRDDAARGDGDGGGGGDSHAAADLGKIGDLARERDAAAAEVRRTNKCLAVGGEQTNRQCLPSRACGFCVFGLGRQGGGGLNPLSCPACCYSSSTVVRTCCSYCCALSQEDKSYASCASRPRQFHSLCPPPG